MKILQIFEPYKNVYETFSSYWTAYARDLSVFLRSPYFMLSIFLTLLVSRGSSIDISKWFTLNVIVSSILLGSIMIVTAIIIGMNHQFIDILRGPDLDDENSPFLVVIASFTHFALFQALSLINAIISYQIITMNRVHEIFSIWLFMYATLLSIAAIMAIFKLSVWYDSMPKDNH
jgi:hypothetical protein